MFEVAVVGGGPAGAVAARALARAGRRVLLFEPRLGLPGGGRWKPGEALPGAARRLLRALELPVLESDRHGVIGGNLSAWGSATLVARDFLAEPDGPGIRLDRARFEEDLRASAVAAGVRAVPAPLRSAKRDGETWSLRWGKGEHAQARWLVDATGRSARIARAAGALRERDEPLVAVAARTLPDPSYRLNRTLIETVPEGWWYAGLLPDGGAALMLHTSKEVAARHVHDANAFGRALSRTIHISRFFPRPTLLSPPRGFEACGARLDRFHGPGWVACGDAAQSFDPIAAQGLFSALHGGMEVGAALDAALDGDDSRLQAYAVRLEQVRRIYRDRVKWAYAARSD